MNDESKTERAANPFPAVGGDRDPSSAMTSVASDRQMQEVQAGMVIAKRFPRNRQQATEKILTACTSPQLAEMAQYAYQKGGQLVSGPSIRLAEVVAQYWGNLWCGVTELDQRAGESTAEAYAWDLETNTRDARTFTVPHVRHTKKGSYKLEDPREIYELVANQGARRKRAAIQMVVPTSVFEAAMRQCDITLKNTVSVDEESVTKMVEAFGEQFGVTRDQLVKFLGHRLDSMVEAEMLRLKKVYASLRDGFAGVADFFEPDESSDEGAGEPGSGADRFREAVGKKKASSKKAASKKKAAAKQDEPEPEPSPIENTVQRMENAQSKDELDEIADEALNGTDIDEAGRERLTKAHKRNAERLDMFAGN